MDPTRELLQHFLATLAYRTQKAVRNAPEAFGDFEAGHGVRTPRALVQHMSMVLDDARSCFGAARQWPDALPTLTAEVVRFHATLADVAAALESGRAVEGGITLERILQGPLADAMTHAGQLALLRRLAGVPVPPENFARAAVDRRRLGVDQAVPVAPAAVWPEAPSDGVSLRHL
jgi:hypothetical protein